MDWIRELAAKHTMEVHPLIYGQNIEEFGTVNGYTYASAFDALNIAHSNGINISAGLENGTLKLITANKRYALTHLKKDDEKMEINVTLNESQIEELIHNVDVNDYEEFLTMDEWNDYMSDLLPTEIIDSTGGNYFNTSDEYAVMDGSGHWYSSSSLDEIFEPHLEDMLQEYLDGKLH